MAETALLMRMIRKNKSTRRPMRRHHDELASAKLQQRHSSSDLQQVTPKTRHEMQIRQAIWGRKARLPSSKTSLSQAGLVMTKKHSFCSSERLEELMSLRWRWREVEGSKPEE